MEIYNDTYLVYIHINKINNKMYIGITSKKANDRWRNGNGYTHCEKFWNAINKYGWNNFEHEIFAANLTKDEACNMEKFLIKELNTQNDLYGYNIDSGGYASKHTFETIEKIRSKNIGKIVSEETKIKIKNARSKQIMTKESIEKTAQKNRGKTRSIEFKENIKNKKKQFMKKVLCVETKQIFESISEASRIMNIRKSSISSNCNNISKTAHGYTFCFINSND